MVLFNLWLYITLKINNCQVILLISMRNKKRDAFCTSLIVSLQWLIWNRQGILISKILSQ